MSETYYAVHLPARPDGRSGWVPSPHRVAVAPQLALTLARNIRDARWWPNESDARRYAHKAGGTLHTITVEQVPL